MVEYVEEKEKSNFFFLCHSRRRENFASHRKNGVIWSPGEGVEGVQIVHLALSSPFILFFSSFYASALRRTRDSSILSPWVHIEGAGVGGGATARNDERSSIEIRVVYRYLAAFWVGKRGGLHKLKTRAVCKKFPQGNLDPRKIFMAS